jgi:hypothetical protein
MFKKLEEAMQMGSMRTIVFIVALVNFFVGLGWAFLGLSAGGMSTVSTLNLVWVVLSAFCSLCVVFWVTIDEESLPATNSTVTDTVDTTYALHKLEGAVNDKLALIDKRLKKLEPQQNIEEEAKIVRVRPKITAQRNSAPQEHVCGNCVLFGTYECKRNEKQFKAEPCSDFLSGRMS